MLVVNLMGMFLCMQVVLVDVQVLGCGCIVNIVSMVGQCGYVYVLVYVVVKYGVIGLMCLLVLEFVVCGVIVNVVCFGYMEIDIVCESIDCIVVCIGCSVEEVCVELVKGNLQGWLIVFDEVVNVVVWLCFEGVLLIMGQVILVFGGEVM